MKRLVLILLIPLFVLACGSADNADGELVAYTSPNYPVTFLLPEQWAIEDNEDSITIASEESLLFANSVTDGARINLSVTPTSFSGNANATEVIETAVRRFREQEGTELLQEIDSRIINNQSAVETVLSGEDTAGNKIILRYMVIENLVVGQTAVVAAVHDASQNIRYGQLMVDIVNSIQMGEEVP